LTNHYQTTKASPARLLVYLLIRQVLWLRENAEKKFEQRRESIEKHSASHAVPPTHTYIHTGWGTYIQTQYQPYWNRQTATLAIRTKEQ